MLPRTLTIILLACLPPAAGGCFLIKKPDKANIQLRKQNQQQQDRIAELERSAQGDAALVQSLQDRAGSLPTLPRERLAKLFTTHDLRLLPLTGGADLEPSKPGEEGLKVYVAPLDETGDPIKAVGTFTIEAFDPSRGTGEKIGTWTLDAAAVRQHWTSVLNRYNYVLPLPWQTPPAGTTLHLSVTFVDELTQGKFAKTADVTVQPRPTPTPGTGPAPAATAPVGP